ncbi:hypothetical protein FGU65_03880 [Methanoculleus sp. FWC-SCC1]|uniref:Uncharacterized protein n=1 Tax=Methanoculleus frigidifontis TaxID=2584085 RepID=A0ABT8M7Y5_9EURY|nr:hypothetical protein [Methanoculleus sp. FWC-SCC1]MDN7024037.1 hypothetical protein [Methanoculleus sp. FWC-SCC1]
MADPGLTIEIGADILWVLLAVVIVAIAFVIGMIVLMRRRMAAMMEYGCHCMPPAEAEPHEEKRDR